MENGTDDTGNNTIAILFENEDVMVINKPSGMMVHADGRHDGETVADWLVARLPAAREVGEPQTLPDGTVIERSGVVHRLDRETSGVMVLAKNQGAFEHLKKQFHDRHAQKEYRAFVYGNVKENEGVIDRPIGRSTQDFRLKSAQRGAKGTLREAVTRWQKLAGNSGYAYLALFPETGRTHQIRVHLKAINHPVVCDKLYAPNHPAALGFDRLALHAYRLTLTLPDESEHTFVAPLPAVFQEEEKKLGYNCAP